MELELQQLQNAHELQALHEFFLRKEDQFMADWERRLADQEKRMAESEWRKERQALLRQLYHQSRRQEQEKVLTGLDTPATVRKKPKAKPLETAVDQTTNSKPQPRQEKEIAASATTTGLDQPTTDPVATGASSTYVRQNVDSDLLRMLSQGPASDSEGDETPMSSLILPVTPAKSTETPRKPVAKRTPKRLLLSARKEADPLDFDFTFRRNAAKEAAAVQAQVDGELPPLGSAPSTPAAKKALKRRKEVTAGNSSGLSVAARLVSAGPSETDVGNPQDTERSKGDDNQKTDSPEAEALEPEDEPTPIECDIESDKNEEEPAKSKKGSRSKAAEDGDERSSKPAKKAMELKNVTRRKRNKHLDAVQEAVAKADRLAQIASMQDISTPKPPVKKAKKAGGLAEKRAQFQQLRSSGPHVDEQNNETESLEGPPAIVSIGEANGSFLPYVTPRRGRALKRKRALQQHQKQQQPESHVSDRSKDRQSRVNATAAAPSNPDLLGSLSMLSPRIPLSIRKRSRASPSSMLAAQELINGSSKTAIAVPEKKRKPVVASEKDDGAASAAAAYAAQRLTSGLTTRSKRKALFNAAGASGFGAKSLASAGPSFFDSFVGARK